MGLEVLVRRPTATAGPYRAAEQLASTDLVARRLNHPGAPLLAVPQHA